MLKITMEAYWALTCLANLTVSQRIVKVDMMRSDTSW